jgi:succinate dehydrogenase/fumarate reductase flavoprotein subunit
LNQESLGFVVFNAVNVVLGTGGPAGIYKTSAYPGSQLGSSGLAYEVGAVVMRVPTVTHLGCDPTEVIATGDWVRVSADHGLVEVIKKD